MPRSVAELLEHAVQHFGDRAFLCMGSSEYTVAAFVASVRRATTRLVANGVHPGDRVAILLPSIVRVLWELPHTANGKVDVPALATRLNPCIDGT